jgi:hypothetical protein
MIKPNHLNRQSIYKLSKDEMKTSLLDWKVIIAIHAAILISACGGIETKALSAADKSNSADPSANGLIIKNNDTSIAAPPEMVSPTSIAAPLALVSPTSNTTGTQETINKTVADTVTVSPPGNPSITNSQPTFGASSLATNVMATSINTLCTTKTVEVRASNSQWRKSFAFPRMLEVDPGTEVISGCIRVVGLNGLRSVSMQRSGKISINGGPFLAGGQNINEGDTIKVAVYAPQGADESYSESLIFEGGLYLGGFEVRTRNNFRSPSIYKIDSSKSDLEIAAVFQGLSAGDIVEVGPGIYNPFEFKRSGSSSNPIIVRGVGTSRPVIKGYSESTVVDYGVNFTGSNNIVFENFEVTGAVVDCTYVQNSEQSLAAVYKERDT